MTTTETTPGGILHCLGFKPVSGGRLIGMADYHVPRWRAKLFGCAVFRDGEGRLSVALPTRSVIGAGGMVAKDRDGRTKLEPTIAFDDPQTARAFSEAAVSALLVYRPDLAGGGYLPQRDDAGQRSLDYSRSEETPQERAEREARVRERQALFDRGPR